MGREELPMSPVPMLLHAILWIKGHYCQNLRVQGIFLSTPWLCEPASHPPTLPSGPGCACGRVLGKWPPSATPALTRLFPPLILQALGAKGFPLLLFRGCLTISCWFPSPARTSVNIPWLNCLLFNFLNATWYLPDTQSCWEEQMNIPQSTWPATQDVRSTSETLVVVLYHSFSHYPWKPHWLVTNAEFLLKGAREGDVWSILI